MVRGKKPEDKPKEGQTISVDVESFVRMRNSVIANLATLQESVQGVSSSYIAYTNTVLGESSTALDVISESTLSRLGTNPLLRGLGRAASPAKSATGEVKLPKKKRAHDPNAPKRPLTPYFLYMQTARPIIAADLGPDVPKGAVSTEGVKRWNAMANMDKQLWTAAYTDNLKLYNARVHSYKAGNQSAKDMTDEEASAYAEVHNIGVGLIEPTADGQLTSEALLDLPSNVGANLLEEDDEEDMPVLVKEAPKSKGSKAKPRSKVAPIVPMVASSTGSTAIIPPAQRAAAAAAEAEKEKEKSPDKKRKRTSTKAKREEVVDSIEEEAPVEPAPKASDKKKRVKKS